jgi:hypothetical protein
MNANDNKPPIKLTVSSFENQPDTVFIAMNRPGAIYGASREEARKIAQDLLAAANRWRYRIFISYSSADAEIAAELAARLRSSKI